MPQMAIQVAQDGPNLWLGGLKDRTFRLVRIQLEPLAATVGYRGPMRQPSSRYRKTSWCEYAVHKRHKATYGTI